MNNINKTFLSTVFLSLLLFMFRNKSNFAPEYIIPIIVALLVKYLLGDWDKGYTWSSLDIQYWLFILIISYITIIIIKNIILL
tara:strand:+ start:34 stop:282 length:249 start_codon:yes stop_codon:yes gene_type:complete